jgi:hypothetical protein
MLYAFGIGIMLGFFFILMLIKLTMTDDPMRGLILLGTIAFITLGMLMLVHVILFIN